ncbi:MULTISPECIES: acyltransferase family protein [Xanthomonas]|nr:MULTISPECIES: acyltransferase family protein [Xanthomonas]MBB4729649.1 peptidoglycan/LPS O-acetylase OafA/YrhL [Xanthomonas arboricola]MBB4770967.1 peptidoglycan/LPS O-acetylase OafA/YrhL [Xanthomonas arboricola]
MGHIILGAGRPMQRRHDLDWLRVIAFGLLVLYHVGMYYVTWDWHVKSSSTHLMLEPVMLLSSPWRMSLLFLISGVATAFMLNNKPEGLLYRRSRQLLLPLLFGMAVIVPPQSYYQVVEQLPGGYRQGYLAFYAKYLSAYQGFCGADGDCLRLPTWNHLWFLPYLWAYTLVVWLLWRLLPAAAKVRLCAWAARPLQGWGALLVPLTLLAVARLVLVARFQQTNWLFDDWYNHAQYLLVFLIGVLIAPIASIWESLQRLRWVALLLASCSYALMIHTWYFSIYDDAHPAPTALRLLLRAVWAVEQWCAIAAILGFAYRFRHADGAVLRYLTAAVFPVYVLHQTIIVVLAHSLKPLALPQLAESATLIVATAVLCLASYEVIRKQRWLRPLFGLPTLPAPRAAIPIKGETEV